MTEPASRSDARQNRERLLTAAREVFAEKGIGAEIKDIADRAGVGVGTLYRNFATKDELIGAMITEMLCQFEDALSAAESIESVRDGLLHLFRTGWALVEEHGALVTALVDAGYDRHGHGHGHGHGQELTDRARALVQRGVDQGELRQDIPPRFLSDFLDICMPFVYVHLRHQWTAGDAARYCEGMLMSAMTAAPWPGKDSA